MTDRPTSILSEHSAEFALIPAVSAALEGVYSKIVPLYFWLSREGGRLARAIHEYDSFHAVALFPRRPKFRGAGDEQLIVTVNQRVLMAAQVLEDRGVPAICGCPLISDFWDLSSQPECVFIGLSDSTSDEYVFDLERNIVKPRKHVLRSNESLLRFIASRAKALNLEELIVAVRESRSLWGGQIYGSHMLAAGYKPVIFLLKS